jgi:hypothetical protein
MIMLWVHLLTCLFKQSGRLPSINRQWFSEHTRRLPKSLALDRTRIKRRLKCLNLLSLSLCLWFYSPLDIGHFVSFLILCTVGWTPWTGDQPAAKPLPTHRINAHNTDIYALSGIRAHGISVRTGKECSCFRPRGHCVWSLNLQVYLNTNIYIYMQLKYNFA